jgi:hypothetical protein
MRKFMTVVAVLAMAACGGEKKSADTMEKMGEAAGAAMDSAAATVGATVDSVKAAGAETVDSVKAAGAAAVEKTGEAVNDAAKGAAEKMKQ